MTTTTIPLAMIIATPSKPSSFCFRAAAASITTAAAACLCLLYVLFLFLLLALERHVHSQGLLGLHERVFHPALDDLVHQRRRKAAVLKVHESDLHRITATAIIIILPLQCLGRAQGQVVV